MIRAYIFDLDNTLIDTRRKIVLPVLKELGENRPIKKFNDPAEDIIKKYIDRLSLDAQTRNWLESLEGRKFLVTYGDEKRQRRKIEVLGLEQYFDKIIITQGDKKEIFENILEEEGLKPQDVLVIGDREESEIKAGRELGCQVQIMKKGLRVVSIGGGTGQPVLLQGLKRCTSDITAIVTVADAGGSSGVLRREQDVLPPGDIRNCLVALAKDPQRLHELFDYRFLEGGLQGHSFGNLFLTALAKITGDFEEAIIEAARMLNIHGKVLPCSLTKHHLCAELEDGTLLHTEPEVENHGTRRIKRLFLEPEPEALKEATDAILAADIVVLGPGSLYTSILPNTLVCGIRDALEKTAAKIVFVHPIFTQAGETDNFSAQDYVNEVRKYVGRVDYFLLNNTKPPADIIKNYAIEGKELVLGPIDGDYVEQDLLPAPGEKAVLWAKRDWMRHDPDKLAQAIISLSQKIKKVS